MTHIAEQDLLEIVQYIAAEIPRLPIKYLMK